MTAGRETTPNDVKATERLREYWLHGKGAALWVETPDPWTNLYHQLLRFMSDDLAKRAAAQWFHERFGFWPGSDKNRVLHGKPPRGKKIGPG
jgi:hypothetical protein